MKLCYADDNGSYDTMANDNSLTQWVIGAGLAAMTTILGFLMRWVFGRLTGGIEELKAQMLAGNRDITAQLQRLADTQQRQDTTIQLMQKDIGYLQGEVVDLRQEVERLRSEQIAE